VLGAVVLWSLSGVVTKRLDLEPTTIALYRSLFAGLALMPFVPRSHRVVRPAIVPCALAFGVMVGAFITAVKATSAANAILLQSTAVFWIVPAGFVLLGERPDRRSLAGIGLATLGVAGIVTYGYRGASEWSGIALGLASGVAYAMVITLMRSLRDLDPIWLSVLNNLGGALALGAWMLATGVPPPRPDAGMLIALFGFGVIQMAIPYALFARGLREVGASKAGLIGLLEPVLNPLWVALFTPYHEMPATATVIGGLFLLSGVACSCWPARRPPVPHVGGEEPISLA
jgi:drug/metabolite transporter (DMT)-like permease